MLALLIKQAFTFHLVKTEPINGSKPNQYTAIVFAFNQKIQPSGGSLNQISIAPNVAGRTTVGAKSVMFVPDSAYSVGINYVAVLSSVMNTKGKSLNNLRLSFTPQHIDYSNLPKDVQQRLVNQTDTNDSKKTPYSASVIAIQGSNELLDRGLSSQQLTNLQRAFFNFFQSKHIEIRGLVLSNIVKTPHDPNSASMIDSVSFSATLDNKTVYSARLDYSNLTTIRLQLFDLKASSLVYDSGDVNN